MAGNKFCIFIMVFMFFSANQVLSQNVVRSIIPPMNIIRFIDKHDYQLVEKEDPQIVLVAKSKWPKTRSLNAGIIYKVAESFTVDQGDSGRREESRVYIMGNTVPIFKSMIPISRPL